MYIMCRRFDISGMENKIIFHQESDVLAFRSHDTTSWTVSWVREITTNDGQTNVSNVSIITLIIVIVQK